MAVVSKTWAITAPRAQWQGSWVAGVSPWRQRPPCREAGARVRTNAFVRDLDLGVVGVLDGRRLEVVADGLPLFNAAQLVIDTTLVSPIHRDGTPRPRTHDVNGVALQHARRNKEATYPELVGRGAERGLSCWQEWLGGGRGGVLRRNSPVHLQFGVGEDSGHVRLAATPRQYGLDAMMECVVELCRLTSFRLVAVGWQSFWGE